MTISDPKTALVLGASGSLGGAIASELLARGYRVALHHHAHPAACETLAAHAGGNARLYAADFRQPDAVQQLSTTVLADFKRVDVIVCAAGIVRDAPLLLLKEDDLRDVVSVNLKGLFLLLKSFSRQFMKQKSGSVVALSSHAAIAGRAGGAAYAMAQAGTLALVKSAAREFGPFNVRVNAVVPPFIAESGMGRSASPEFIAAQNARRVLKQTSNELAEFARFVANIAEAQNVSGQVLTADSRVT